MNEVKGFKAFNANRTGYNGFLFEEGKTYKIEGDIKYHHNGFHMCRNIANCFRYFEKDNITLARVTGSGKIDEESFVDYMCGFDYDNMYAVSTITIDKFMTRKEVFEEILKCPSYDIDKIIRSYQLDEEEKERIVDKYYRDYSLMSAVLYHCYDRKDVYSLKCSDRDNLINELIVDVKEKNLNCFRIEEWLKWLNFIPEFEKEERDRLKMISYLELDESDMKKKNYYENLDMARDIISKYNNSNGNKVRAYPYLEKNIDEVMSKKLTSEEKKMALEKVTLISSLSHEEIDDIIRIGKDNYKNLSYVDSYILHILIDNNSKNKDKKESLVYGKRKLYK